MFTAILTPRYAAHATAYTEPTPLLKAKRVVGTVSSIKGLQILHNVLCCGFCGVKNR